MEDPWATGPSWSTSTRASTSQRLEESEQAKQEVPPARFDVSDPWGPPATPSLPAPPLDVEESSKTAQSWEYTNGAGGPWGEESPKAAFEPKPPEEGTMPPPREEPNDGPVWSVDTPRAGTRPLPSDDYEPEIHQAPVSPVVTTPPRPTSFPQLSSLDESLPSPSSIREELEPDHGLPIPQSPSFGEEGFGGFSGGFQAGDPWGGGGFGGVRDEWGNGEGSGGSLVVEERDEDEDEDEDEEEDEDEDEDEEDEGEGWGGARGSRAASAPLRALQEDDWEEAQRRIKLKQERAVSRPLPSCTIEVTLRSLQRRSRHCRRSGRILRQLSSG